MGDGRTVVHLGVDVGRFEVKVIGNAGYRDKFSAHVGEARQLKAPNDLRGTDIQLCSDKFKPKFVGTLAQEESYSGARNMMPSKVHQDTLVLAVAAVARAVPSGASVRIAIGVPYLYHTDDVKKALRGLIEGSHVAEINGKEKKFTIEQVAVGIEGLSAHMVLAGNRPGTFRYLDLGSTAMNFGTMSNGRRINKESNTLVDEQGRPYGCDTLIGVSSEEFVRRVVSDLSLYWRTFDHTTFVFGQGVLKHGLEFSRYIPRMLCATSPAFVTAQALYQLSQL